MYRDLIFHYFELEKFLRKLKLITKKKTLVGFKESYDLSLLIYNKKIYIAL